MAIKVKQTIEIYEIDGTETMRREKGPTLSIDSHWTDNKFICLLVDGKSYAVCAKDLRKAIQNATNS
ncbi:MAG: hypothetical protein V2B18_25415 [Pseudomonadota bacterium]